MDGCVRPDVDDDDDDDDEQSQLIRAVQREAYVVGLEFIFQFRLNQLKFFSQIQWKQMGNVIM